MNVRFWAGVVHCVPLSCGISRAAIGVALCCLDPAAVCQLICLYLFVVHCVCYLILLQLSAMDVSARTTMKGAAKCDNLCELQNSVNQ